MDISGNGKAESEETEKLNNETALQGKAEAEEAEKIQDNTESGARSSYVEAIQVANESEYQSFRYADYTNLFWGGCVNGLVVGVLIGLLASAIKSLYNITQNNKGE